MQNQLKRQNSGLPIMESVVRFGNIPVVETGLKTAGTVYQKVKTSNGLFNWSLETAETVTYALIESLRPAARLIEGPLHRIDSLMCKSLDFVEQKVPSLYLPPELIYWNTKEYMSDHLVRPVLSRASSVKNLGHAVLDSRVSNYAAGRLDGALNVCDKYVDRFLPVEPADDQTDGASRRKSLAEPNDPNEMHVMQTIHRGQRISRKLKRRLTFRTRQELHALKKQSTEAVHVLFYATELIATNPRLALQKGIELWQYLSADEPENQARPQTLEQLVVLLTRESARKLVHLINYTGGMLMKVPKKVRSQTRELVHHLLFATDGLIKVVHLERVKAATVNEATGIVHRIQHTYDELQNQTNLALHGQLSLAKIDTHQDCVYWMLLKLERLAVFLSGRLEAEKITTSDNPRRRIQNRPNNNPMHTSINGVY
ncbi:lipid storage droplets surface-binding protein 1 isoform X2 [Toxorhynchites rutilus septentrionalis]|uniref:lipid storage droplets surface-binding protein 1 isoform X2 n=1 Tax=Toxorhynchites rutilus septentrionalis TaxID=329112 RepID=UPI00247990C7|nr:lipid storage droplets surface-binding protein 1 isoform X2 [Toxorhynchites rutilus septentrionalis]